MKSFRIALAAGVFSLVATPALPQARGISASDRAQGAQANTELLAQFGGRYSGPQAAYVERIGKRVAVQSGLSNAQSDFTVTLIDSPVENAFAIPGGYVYVTRQLLALMNSEAELAAVLGHEVGHVAARHSQRRNQRSTIAGVLAGLAGAAIGSDLVTRGLNVGAQLYSLGYSRSQEYEADALGVRYSAAAGYDPGGMAAMLAQLNAEQTLSGRIEGRDQRLPGWASTHPNGAERVARARQLAARLPAAAAGWQDTAFLRALDGMRYDDDPAQGTVDGNRFRHPGLRAGFTAPQGYTIANGAQAVTVSGSGGQAQFRAGAATGDLAGFVRQRFAELGASGQVTPQTTTVNGLAMAYATTRATSGGRAVDATVAAYRFPSATLYFLLVTPAGSGVGPFESLLDSVGTLTGAEAGAVRGRVIRIHTVRAGDTIDSLARQMAYPDFQRERFVILNGLDGSSQLEPGRLVKLVVNG